MLLLTLFLLNISLLFIHEMDAVRRREWKMFIGLKGLNDELGYAIFTALHLPIYFFILIFLVQGFAKHSFRAYLVTDIALLIHLLVHLLFTKHRGNGFKGLFSRGLIYLMGLISLIHLLILLLS